MELPPLRWALKSKWTGQADILFEHLVRAEVPVACAQWAADMESYQHVGEHPAEPALEGPWTSGEAGWWEAQPVSVSQNR